MFRISLIISIIFLLNSCTTGRWYKSGATAEEFYEVNYICLQESQQSQTTAHSHLNHYTPNTVYMSDPVYKSSYSSSMVTNQNLYNACMNAHGFVWVTGNQPSY